MRWIQFFSAGQLPVALVDRWSLRNLSIQTFLARLKPGAIVTCFLLFCSVLISAQELKKTGPAQKKPPVDVPLNVNRVPKTGVKYPALDEAQKKFASGDPKGSLALLREAIKKHPELRPPQVILASMFFTVKNVVAGRAALDKAVQEQPNHPDAFLVLGELALTEGRFTDATLLYEKAVQLTVAYSGNKDTKKNFQIRCYAGLAAVARHWEKWSTSHKHLTSWLKLDPKNSMAMFQLGQTLFQMGQRKDAYAKIQEAYKLNDKMPHPDITMGLLFAEQGEKTKAVEWMEYAAKMNSKNENVLFTVASWYWNNAQVEKAKAHAKATAALNSKASGIKLLLGLIARYERDYQTALQHFESLHKQEPNHFLTANHLALTLIELNTDASRTGALKLAETLFKQNPNNPMALATLGWISFRMGKQENAGNLLSAAAARTSDNETAYYLARLLQANKLPEKAKKILQKALKDPRPFVYRKDAEDFLKRLEKQPK